MKNSRKYFWIILGILVAMPIIFLIAFKLTVFRTDENYFKPNNENWKSDNLIERTYDYNSFTDISVAGVWDVDICYGDNYSVEVKYYKDFADENMVEKKGNTLYFKSIDFKNKKLHWHRTGMMVKIIMPSLNKIYVEGGTDLKIKDFNTENIVFNIGGAAQIVGENCICENLFLVVDGSTNFDFDKSKVTNADVNINGAANIELNMAGGELTGKLSGIGNISYSGDVSLINVEKDGLGVIERVEH